MAAVPSAPDLEQLYAYPDVDRPWVRTDFVATLDGAAWTGEGTSGALGGDADKAAFSMMRSLADVVVVGAGTARTEGYRPLTPASVDQTVRERHGLAPAPVLVVVSRSLDVPDSLADGGAVIVTSRAAPPARLTDLRGRTEVLQHGDDAIDWPAVLHDFAARGWNRVLCEGGPSLHGDLLAADLVDEVCLTIAPVVAAGDASRIAHGRSALDRPARLGHAVAVGDVLLTRWTLDRP